VRRTIRFLWKSLPVIVGALFLFGLPWIFIRMNTQARIVSALPEGEFFPVAIVFGAGLYRDGTPLPVLADRVETAADLYKAGSVRKLLLSGDNRFPDYNEPEGMRTLALQLGIPPEDIVLDYAGRSTYDTCYRARQIFGVRRAVLVTQAFHLPRAVYLCENLGLEVMGVTADRRTYRRSSEVSWNLREVAASAAALLEVHLLHPQPVLGPLEPLE
jgi:SanA protein